METVPRDIVLLMSSMLNVRDVSQWACVGPKYHAWLGKEKRVMRLQTVARRKRPMDLMEVACELGDVSVADLAVSRGVFEVEDGKSRALSLVWDFGALGLLRHMWMNGEEERFGVRDFWEWGRGDRYHCNQMEMVRFVVDELGERFLERKRWQLTLHFARFGTRGGG